MIPYLIWSYDYSHATGGVKVLHRLCHELNEAGQEAYVSGSPNPEWNTPQSDPFPTTDEAHHWVAGDWIAIYPEVVSGNPWNAPRVVRYVLNHPGKLGGDKTYDPSEIVYVYHPIFDDVGAGPDRILTLPTVELEIYQNRHLPRSGALYYVGKGRRTRDLPGAVEITPELRADREALAAALNQADVLYTFDGMTGMSDIARLCGCPVILIPDPGEQPRRATAWIGIGFGLMPPPFDSEVVRAEQIALHERFRAQLASFIRTTQERSTSREISPRQIGVEA
jgi:O-antigen biosynthesis protein